MSQEKFDLMFSGELVPGYDLAQVKQNIQLLFRIDAAKTDVLFSGRAIALKKGLDAETANKYRVAIKKAGARVAVLQSESAGASPQAAAEANAPSKPSATSANKPAASGFSTALGAQPLAPSKPRAVIDAPEYNIADPGADMLSADYKLPLAEVDIDVSSLSIAPQEGNLVNEGEIVKPAAKPVKVPDIEVAPAGSDMLKINERAEMRGVDVDISGLSVAPVGERLAPPSAPAPPPPKVDHIRLKD